MDLEILDLILIIEDNNEKLPSDTNVFDLTLKKISSQVILENEKCHAKNRIRKNISIRQDLVSIFSATSTFMGNWNK